MVKRLVSIALAFLMTFGTIATALASTTIGTQNSTNYFDFLSDSGTWADLKTPRHHDNSTGNVAYCLQHDKDFPSSSASYNEFNPSSLMSVSVQAGLKAILENGYPAKTGGFSNDQAQYATANAIRTYLREAAGLGYNFMLLSNNKTRPKAGYDSLYNWMLQLVQTGRTGGSTAGTASITVTPLNQTWQTVGSQLMATVSVSCFGFLRRISRMSLSSCAVC